MSIATEIERLQNAKASIKTAIENKGVEVGDGTIDTYASKIDQISGSPSEELPIITDTSYLFNSNARVNIMNDLLKLCKNVKNMSYMYQYSSGIQTIDLSNFDMSSVEDVSYMCHYTSKLKTISFGNQKINNIKNIYYWFNGCSVLVDLDLSNFDLGKVTQTDGFMKYASALVNLRSFKNLGKGYTSSSKNYYNYVVDFSYSTKLSHDSLIDLITNGLYDLNITYANLGWNVVTQQLILGSTNLAKLTAEEIAIATNKGWTVS
jgi:surface protein